MPIPRAATYLALWYRALEAEIGITIEVRPEDLRVFSTYMYAARSEAQDPRLAELMIALPNGGKELFVLRKTTELETDG